LKVESVLEGTIQRGGGRLRVSVQLVNASDGAVVWADSFEEAENDVFKLQDAIVTRVFAALRVEVSPKQKESFALRESISPEANALYLKARFYWNKRNSENLKKAVELFEQAVAKDPNFALGFVGVSDGYQMLSEYGGIDRKAAMERARAAVNRALEIDGEMGEAHCSLGYLQAFYDWDFAAADASFKKAVSLSPKYATAHQWYGEFLNSQGRSDDGLAELNRAAGIDPLSPIILTDIAANYYTSRKYDEAIAAVARVDEIAPKFPFAYYLLALAYEKKGMKTEAVRMYYIADSSWFPSLVKSTEADYLVLGYEALAQKRYREVTTPPLAMFTNGYQKAMGALLTGDRDAVFRHLEDSLASRDRWFINLKNDPQWDDLRTDARFADLLKRAGLGG
jgi:tetratricopeptide (TPR) repeat protein